MEHIGDSRMRENRHNSTQKARFSTCQAENPMPRKWHQMAPFSLPNGTKWHLFFKAPQHADSHAETEFPVLSSVYYKAIFCTVKQGGLQSFIVMDFFRLWIEKLKNFIILQNTTNDVRK